MVLRGRLVPSLALACALTSVACKPDALDLGPGGGEAGAPSGPIFIRSVFAPTVPTNGECTYTADPTQAELSGGAVDVSFASLATYSPEVLLGNDGSGASAADDQAGASRVIIKGGYTRITDLAGDMSIVDLLATMCDGGSGDPAACATGKAVESGRLATPTNPFSTVETTTLEPPTGSSPSYSAMSLTLVDGATIAVMRAYFESALQLNGASAFTTSIQLLTYTQVSGVTFGGDTVQSNVYLFPVTFTYGGLVSNLVANALSPVGYCVRVEAQPTTDQTCTPGQDAPTIVTSVPEVPDCPLGDAGFDAGADGGLADGGAG